CEGKLSSTVLREVRGSDAPRLPDVTELKKKGLYLSRYRPFFNPYSLKMAIRILISLCIKATMSDITHM
ncbi:hypothetical protein ACH0BK_28430, partial [Priestia megaterium]|uniref:hypothetical protein n=1 Tax=Priestia megaterium TaxID=1404 RepID=UPI00387A7F90